MEKTTGAQTRLTTGQLRQLVEAFNKGAEHNGSLGAIWTRPRIIEVIKKLLNTSYGPSQVGRLLKEVDWSRQIKSHRPKPVNRTHWR